MRRTRHLSVVAAFALAAVSTYSAGCSGSDAKEKDAGQLTVSLSVQSEKTLWPQGWESSIGTFDVLLKIDEDGDLELHDSATIDAGVTDPITFDELPFGDYTITVLGLCDDGAEHCLLDAEIAFGEQQASIDSETPVEVTVVVGPEMSSDGAMMITLEWPEEIEVGEVVSSTAEVEGDWIPGDSFVTFDNENGMDLIDTGIIEASPGSHMIRFEIYDLDSELVSSAIEVVNVYGNYTTVGTISLSEDDFVTFPDPDEPDYEELVEELDDAQLSIHVTNWDGDGPDTPLRFPGAFNDWSQDEDHQMLYNPPETSLVIEDAVTAANLAEIDDDHFLELKMCSGFDWEDWDTCWAFFGDGWTVDPADGGFIGDAGDGLNSIYAQATSNDALLIVIDVSEQTIRFFSDAREDEEDPTGAVDVEIVIDDPAPADPFEIQCVDGGDDIVCSHDESFQNASYSWYLNGVDLEEHGEELTLAKQDLNAGYRVTLVVITPPFAESAHFTITAAMLEKSWDFVQTFDAAEFSLGTYEPGTYVDETGVEWTYVALRSGDADGGDYAVGEDGGVIARDTSSISAEVDGGISELAVDAMKAFTGGTTREFELHINGELVEEFFIDSGSGADYTVFTLTASDLDVEGTFTIELKNFSAQVAFNNIRWDEQ